jgi:hypothetical protein
MQHDGKGIDSKVQWSAFRLRDFMPSIFVAEQPPGSKEDSVVLRPGIAVPSII